MNLAHGAGQVIETDHTHRNVPLGIAKRPSLERTGAQQGWPISGRVQSHCQRLRYRNRREVANRPAEPQERSNRSGLRRRGEAGRRGRRARRAGGARRERRGERRTGWSRRDRDSRFRWGRRHARRRWPRRRRWDVALLARGPLLVGGSGARG